MSLILDDVAALGAQFGEPLRVFTVDEVASGLEVQAAWHGRSFGWTANQMPAVPVGSQTVRDAAKVLLSQGYWEQHFAEDWAPSLPASQQDQVRTRRAIEALYAKNDAGTLCLVHGDAHIGNTYTLPPGGVRFLDWQCVNLGSWAYDVAYFMIGALNVDDRRDHERDLLHHYLTALASHGGPEIAFDDAFREYRLNCRHGFMWTTTSLGMQPAARIVAMSDRHTAAIEDHDSVALALAGLTTPPSAILAFPSIGIRGGFEQPRPLACHQRPGGSPAVTVVFVPTFSA
jgi:Ecdysteroid kinase-like family